MKTERFEMRFDPETLDQVDTWRRGQSDLPSRAEALRRLVGVGLAMTDRDEVQISDGEKLILMMLRDLIDPDHEDGKSDTEFIAKAIYSGHHWGIKCKLPGLFPRHVDHRRVLPEVLNILEVWDFLESGYARLPEEEKSLVKVESGLGGSDVVFRGFDGNNEGEHIDIALFVVNELDRFERFKGRDLNAHMPTLDGHRRMRAVFEPMIQTLAHGGELSSSQIISLLKAKI